MKEYLKGRPIRLRCKKSYPDAHTHLMIGKVVEETGNYIVVHGRTFHFNRIVDGLRSQVFAGEVTTRAIPWDNIEIIHELDQAVDYRQDFTFAANGDLILADKNHTVIAQRRNGEE